MMIFGTLPHQREEEQSDRFTRELLELESVLLLADQIVTNLPPGAQRRVESTSTWNGENKF